MKILLRLVVVLVVIAALAVVALIFWGGQIIQQGVNTVGPQVLGVPVRLEHARFYPLRGHVHLSGLFVGNPEGFRTESLFRMQTLEVDLNVRSLLSDEIVIERILIDAPQITYEVGTRRTNIGTLLAALEGEAKPETAPAPTPREDVGPGKQVVIKELILADARANVSATAMGGRVVPVQLSTMVLRDLGGEDQSIRDIVTEVMKAVAGAVGNAVAGAGDLLGDGLKSALEGVGALSGVATEGVRAVTGTAGEGARAATETLGGAARGLRERLPGSERGGQEVPDLEVPELPEIPDDEVTDEVKELKEIGRAHV